MNIKKTVFATLLASTALCASAQEAKTEYVFQPHWYVQGQFGAQYTLGEVSMGKLISPNAQLGVGYNFALGHTGKAIFENFGGNAGSNTDYRLKYKTNSFQVHAAYIF